MALIAPSLVVAETVTNPTLSQSCGLDIALVIDSSGSIHEDELVEMKGAYHDFVNTLLPATPTQFAVIDFDSNATTLQSFTNDLTLISNAIEEPTSSGRTNWEQGLMRAQEAFDPRPSVPNLVIFASDGNPNRKGSSNVSEATALAAAVTVADDLKNSGTRILAVGIGNNLDVNNLKAISGPNVDDGLASDVITSSFSDLADDLAEIATEHCGGTITVTKVVDRDGNVETTEDQTPGVEWSFVVGASEQSTDETGKTQAVPLTNGVYSVSEVVQDNYNLVSAFCTNQNESPMGDFSSELKGVTGIEVSTDDIISCVFVNQPSVGTLTVIKNVVNDNEGEVGVGTSVASDFSLSVQESIGGGAPFVVPGSPFNGSESGTPVSLDGDSTYVVSEADPGSYAVSYSEDCTGTMPAGGQKTCTVTNNDLPAEQGSLTVVKMVVNDNGGTATKEDFPLSISGVTEQSVNSGEANLLDPGAYTVSEVGDAQRYAAVFTGDCDANGQVSVEAGQSYTCFITNDDIAPTIKVVKEVVGSETPASEFTMTVSGTNVSDTSFPGSAEGTTITVDAGEYAVGEVANSLYSMTKSESCTGTIAIGEHKTCTITNTFVQPEDETGTIIVKNIILDSPVSPTGFSFSVNGGTSTPFNDSGISDLILPPGTYTITQEAKSGFTTTYSNCSDLVLTPDITLTCVITNTFGNGGTGGGSGGGGTFIPTGNNNGGGNGGGSNSGGDGTTLPPGQVLGDQTSAPGVGSTPDPTTPGRVLGDSDSVQQCGIYLFTYIRYGRKNDTEDVKRLQKFLNDQGFGPLDITGVYNAATYNAVKRFQVAEYVEVLRPWVPHGLETEKTPTGYVYKTTKRRINNIVCPSLNLPIPPLP